MIRARTIKEAAAYFRAVDPETSLTEFAIRTLLRSGKVPCARIGKKYIVSIEALENFLAGNVVGIAQDGSDNSPCDDFD